MDPRVVRLLEIGVKFQVNEDGLFVWRPDFDVHEANRFQTIPLRLRTHCNAGHPTSEGVALEQSSTRKRPKYWCRLCKVERDRSRRREVKQKPGPKPRPSHLPRPDRVMPESLKRNGLFYPVLECGHSSNGYEKPPMYWETLWCPKCSDWKVFRL